VADYDEVILPGKEGKITVIINGSRIHPGYNKKSFTVTTNDPENGKILLFVAAEVKKVFDVSKDMTLAGFEGEDLEIETEITNVLNEPIRIIDYYWSDKSMELEKYKDKLEIEIEKIEKGKKYRLTLKKKEEIEPGSYMGELVLTTDFDKLKEKKMRVMLTVNPIVDVNPKKILYGEMKIGEGEANIFEKKFHLVAMRGDSLKVLNVIPSRNDVEVDLQTLHPGKAYQGNVKVMPAGAIRNYAATIKILTNYPGYEEFEITVQGSFLQ